MHACTGSQEEHFVIIIMMRIHVEIKFIIIIIIAGPH
jgi:hypothetical protein